MVCIFPTQGLNHATLLQPLPFALHHSWVDPQFFDWLSGLREGPMRESAILWHIFLITADWLWIATKIVKSNGFACIWMKQKEKYRGVFEIQRSGDKTSSGEIGLDIRTYASPKVGQDQVSGGVSVLCWHAAPVAYVLWKPCTIR